MNAKRKTIDLTIEGTDYQVSMIGTNWRDRRSRTLVSCGNQVEPDMEMPAFSTKGVDPENDAAWRKYNREELRLMRAIVDPVVKAEFPGLGKLSFSRTAGCSCGCSPAFRAEGIVIDEEIGRVSWITITRK